MRFLEALSEKEIKVEYYKDSSGEAMAKYNSRVMTLDEFEKISESDDDARALVRVTMKQNKYYPRQVKRFKKLVLDLFHKKTKIPDIEVDKEKVTIYSGRKISAYSGRPRIDTKEVKSSGSEDIVIPPQLGRKQ